MMLALADRAQLARMDYDVHRGIALMAEHTVVTIMLVWAENRKVYHVRNAFAAGGVVDDPATGAAAAALTGYFSRAQCCPMAAA